MNNFKPMLGQQLGDRWSSIPLPIYASAKLDGIRACLVESPRTDRRVLLSRYLKPIANLYIRRTIEQSELPNMLDGELTVGTTFNKTTSGVMSVGGEPEFHYWVFDWVLYHNEYWEHRWLRMQQLREYERRYPWFHIIEQRKIDTLDELQKFYDTNMKAGFEGLMLKHPRRVYVYGRTTPTGFTCVKIKPTLDADAYVIGFTEKLYNDNDEETNELGHTERSSAQAGLSPANTLGALIVSTQKFGAFKIGTGFDDAARQEIWNNRPHYLHKHLTFKYQAFGMKDKPRQPVFLRWRPDLDQENKYDK